MCEDYPCCDHGQCPFTDEKGRERWQCAECGKLLPLKATSSICSACRRRLSRRVYDHSIYAD